MPYSKERLEYALFVFRPKPGEEKSSRPRRAPKYNLRSVARNSPPSDMLQPSIWARTRDKDPDEDYDPSSERRKKPKIALVKRRQSQLGQSEHAKNFDQDGPPTTWTTEDDPTPLATLVTLKIRTEEGRRKLRELAEFHGPGVQWPRKSGNNDMADPMNDDVETTEDLSGYRVLRNRRILKPSARNLSQSPACSRSPIPEDLRCAHCIERDCICELKPGFKGPCKRCNEDGSICATDRYLGQQKMPLVLDDPSIDIEFPRASRTIPTQSYVPVEDQRTVLEIQKGTQTDIRALQTGPTFRQNDGRTKDTAIVIGSPSSPPPESRASSFEHRRYETTIDTVWSHPIDYQFQPQRNALQADGIIAVPCHFCRDYRYRIFGVAQRTGVKVRRLKLGYTEVGGGNRERGYEPTRMCFVCAMEYLHMSKCDHKMTAYATKPVSRLRDWQSMLYDKSHNKNQEVLDRCCRLCLSLASYRCIADVHPIRVRTKTGKFVTSAKTKCRLQLCSDCHKTAANAREPLGETDWKALIQVRGDEPRADIEFFFAGSDLHKAWSVD